MASRSAVPHAWSASIRRRCGLSARLIARRSDGACVKSQPSVGAFAMRVTDTDKLARGPTDVSLVRGPPEAEHVRYPHFVQTGDFPICGIPGC